jgi:hypothetical protein
MIRYILYALIALLILSCGENRNSGDSIMSEDLIGNLKSLQNVKIYFGHQSVGYNILSGLESLAKKSSVDISILEWNENKKLPQSYFLHSRVSKNTKPETKCNDFIKFLQNLNDSIDVALLKFCYVDINADTDINELFNVYKSMIDRLKTEFPKIKLIHVTVPLITKTPAWKRIIKNLMGKSDVNELANIKRNEYNELLKNGYSGEYIFDLAKIESTYTDGGMESFKIDGKEYFSLIEEYSSDGSHLNELGGQLAAKELVDIISKQIYNKKQ